MYTVEIYKTDRRVKAGERLVLKNDYTTDNRSTLEKSVKDHLGKGERYEIHETFVTKRNAMNGQETRSATTLPTTVAQVQKPTGATKEYY